MKKTKHFYKTHFQLVTIKKAYEDFMFTNQLSNVDSYKILEIEDTNETWNFDSIDEFFSNYYKANSFTLFVSSKQKRLSLSLMGDNKNYIRVEVESDERAKVEKTFHIFEENAVASKVIEAEEVVKIFIGHGRDQQWKLLKDHLHEQHGYKIEHYEIGPRAGTTVKEVLESMLNSSSFALLVMTGEDLDNVGNIHARENVIHEIGLFQGRLGFQKALVLKEDGVNEFSNIFGINQIRFSKKNIRESFGDVVAAIKKEFEGKH